MIMGDPWGIGGFIGMSTWAEKSVQKSAKYVKN